MIVGRVKINGALHVKNAQLLPVPHIILQCCRHRLALGFVVAKLQGLFNQFVIQGQIRSHAPIPFLSL